MKTLFCAALAAATISISGCSGDPPLVADPPCHREVSLAPQAAANCPARPASTQNKSGEFGVTYPRIYYYPD
jgi:hypothetical protein